MNPAVAYLVLACGTDNHMAHTKWSVNAIETYTSISRLRAAEALQLLMQRQFIARAGGTWNRPRYRLLAAAECRAVTSGAKTLSGGRLALSTTAWIWLPNTVVTGAAGETPPVDLVRQTQDVMTLRLFVELYGEQHLRVDSGVRRDLVWEQLKRHDLGPAAEFRVWGFDPTPTLHARWIGAAECHKRAGDAGGLERTSFAA
jgi:hypothetical protein